MTKTVTYSPYGSGTDLTPDTTGIDDTVTQGDEGVEDVVEFTLAGSGSSAWFQCTDVETVILVATGAAKFYTGSLDRSVTRELTFGGQCQASSATKCGFIAKAAMPWAFFIKDTSTSSNPMTVYLKRPAGYSGSGTGTV